MKIIKKGKVIPFKCQLCEGKFVAGIHSAKESNGNYYAFCPMCGNECHSSAVDIQEYEKETIESETGVRYVRKAEELENKTKTVAAEESKAQNDLNLNCVQECANCNFSLTECQRTGRFGNC